MLLDIRPFYWVSHEAFTWLIICFTIFAPVIAARLSDRIARELFLWADAVGLGFFQHQRPFLRGRAAFRRSRAHWLA